MTNQEYFDTLLKLPGVKDHEPGITKRKLNITVAMDCYGTPSTAIIAFEGSPSRFEVVFAMNAETAEMPIMVSGRVIWRSGRSIWKAERLLEFLRSFAMSRKAEWNANLRRVLDESVGKDTPVQD